MRNIIGNISIAYTRNMPNHRGRFRMLSVLDRIFGPFILKTPDGPILEIYLSSSMDLSYFDTRKTGLPTKHTIDQLMPSLIKELHPGECFVDVGANVGFLSNLAGRVVGQKGCVIAVEPSPREYVRLLRGISFNRANNIIPIHGAFGDNSTTAVLEVAKAHTGLNRLSNSMDGVDGAWTNVTVPVWKGDEVLPGLVGEKVVGLVKVDTEGAEFLVLSGMQKFLSNYQPKRVVVEITPRFLDRFGSKKTEIYSLMRRLGFRSTINADDDQFDEVFVHEKD